MAWLPVVISLFHPDTETLCPALPAAVPAAGCHDDSRRGAASGEGAEKKQESTRGSQAWRVSGWPRREYVSQVSLMRNPDVCPSQPGPGTSAVPLEQVRKSSSHQTWLITVFMMRVIECEPHSQVPSGTILSRDGGVVQAKQATAHFRGVVSVIPTTSPFPVPLVSGRLASVSTMCPECATNPCKQFM